MWVGFVGLSKTFKKDAEAARLDPTEGRREGERGETDGRRELEMDVLRLGVGGAGDPGCTLRTQVVIAEAVADLRRPRTGLHGLADTWAGGEGRGCVGRFF